MPDRKFPDAFILLADPLSEPAADVALFLGFKAHLRVRTGDTRYTVLHLPGEQMHVLLKMLVSPIPSPPSAC